MAYDIGFEPPLDPPEYDVPICPVCGSECDTLYRDRWGDIIGCGECITIVDAWEETA